MSFIKKSQNLLTAWRKRNLIIIAKEYDYDISKWRQDRQLYKHKIIDEMKKVFCEAPFGVDHTLRVLKFAEEIMDGENIDNKQRELISMVAILHDIGAMEAQRKYGSMAAVYQEKEGPIVAREILEAIGYIPDAIDRICYIIGNHHTPSRIDGIDFQIQWEADLLDNLKYMDIKDDKEKLLNYIIENFKTTTGKKIAYREFINRVADS
jgi:hypothetical protein